jgi:lysozyme family protein
MALFELAAEKTLANEGGFVDDPMDKGGATNFGLSQRSYPTLNIKELTKEEALAIYKRDFWKYDDVLDQRIADKIFDMAFNMGHAAIFLLQEIVLQVVRPDGIWGPVTEDAVNRMDPNALLTAYHAKLEQHYRNIVLAKPEEMKFLDGWLWRAKQ